jgi:hypothetical protein
VDPDTSTLHPVTLPLSSITSPLTLVGLGVRTVSFLSVRVYSAGFYIEDESIKSLHHVPGWNVSLLLLILRTVLIYRTTLPISSSPHLQSVTSIPLNYQEKLLLATSSIQEPNAPSESSLFETPTSPTSEMVSRGPYKLDKRLLELPRV